MRKKCIKLYYNWRQCGEAGDQWGEDYDVHEVGTNGVSAIRQNDDFWVVDFDSGMQELIYNPNRAFFVDA